ncbi:MAG: ABC transporter substrate-binding protein [Alphaproteobacteria bacterium]|nr:ABC transporter substrate-binding protein [Alphaproteobacteria bacterium]
MIRRVWLTVTLAVLSMAAMATPCWADRTITDGAGRQVKVPDKVERVFVAGPPAAVVVYTLAPDKLLGWTHPLSDQAKALMPQKYADLPILGRLTSRSGGDTVIEDVKPQHPDIILDVGDVDTRYAQLADRVQQRTGVPYLLLDGHLAKTAELYRQLGDILGVSAHAEPLAAYAERTLADAARQRNATPQDRWPRIYYVRDPDGTQTAALGSIIGEIFDLAGAVNVAGTTRGAVTFDQVREWNPDMVLTSAPDFARAALDTPQWQILPAVREHRVYRAPLEPFGWIDEPPAANRLLGLKWLASVLHAPSSSSGLREDARSFYATFYHVQLTPQQLDRLLATKP